MDTSRRRRLPARRLPARRLPARRLACAVTVGLAVVAVPAVPGLAVPAVAGAAGSPLRVTVKAPAKATPGAVQEIGTAVRRAGGASVASYVVDFGDGSRKVTGHGTPPATVDHVFAKAGTDKVVVTVTDHKKASSSGSATVRVVPASGCGGYHSAVVATGASTLTVHVVDAKGRPLTGIPVQNAQNTLLAKTGYAQYFTTDCTGSVTLHAPAGHANVEVNDEEADDLSVGNVGYGDPNLIDRPELTAIGESPRLTATPLSLTVVLQPAAVVEGTLLAPGPDGTVGPLAGAHAQLDISQSDSSQIFEYSQTDAAGHYLFGHLRDGSTGLRTELQGPAVHDMYPGSYYAPVIVDSVPAVHIGTPTTLPTGTFTVVGRAYVQDPNGGNYVAIDASGTTVQPAGTPYGPLWFLPPGSYTFQRKTFDRASYSFVVSGRVTETVNALQTLQVTFPPAS